MKISKLLWLIYKRIRVAFVPVSFLFIFSLYTNIFSSHVYFIMLGAFCIEIFGGCYNDYTDYDEDKRNDRTDKLTISGIMRRKQIRNISFIFLAIGLISFVLSNFVIGFYYAFMMWAYSYHGIRLKKYNFKGYFVLATSWILIPFYLGFMFGINFSSILFFFNFFCFFQYMYLLNQKDSTDANDDTNLFIEKGWNKALFICVTLAILSSIFFLGMSSLSIFLIMVWAMNLFIKFYHSYKVHRRQINRELRSRLVLMEFLNPYIYSVIYFLIAFL